MANGILSDLNALLPGIGKFGTAIDNVVQKLTSVLDDSSLKDASKKLTDQTTSLASTFKKLEVGVDRIVAAIQNLQGPGTATKAEPALPTGGGAAAAEGEGGEAAGGAIAAIGGMATAALAAAASFVALVAVTRPFVAALSPVTIAIFDRALKDLSATVGVAFQPIFEILTGTIRTVAGIILPLMQSLKPVFATITGIFSSLLIPVVRLVVAAFDGLMPIIKLTAVWIETLISVLSPLITILVAWQEIIGAAAQILLVLFDPLIEVMKVVQAVFDSLSQTIDVVLIVFRTLVQTVVEFVRSLVAGFKLNEVIDQVKAAFKKVIEIFLIGVATLAKLFGATKFLANLIENLKPKQGAVAAIEGVSIKGFEQIAKDMETSAFSATGTSGENGKEKIDLSDIIKKMEDIASGANSGIEGFAETVKAVRAYPDNPIRP